MKPIRVLLVDDHAVMRMGLASLLGSEPGIEVIDEADDGASGIRKALQKKPDVVLMDLMMPGMDGAEATRLLREQDASVKVLILTTFGTADGLAHALESGALGAILKTATLAELVSAIRNVASGHPAISPEIAQILSENPPVPKLSPRQTEVLESITRGLSNEDIAHQLGISVARVREHLTTLFEKLGAANRAEAVSIALRKHLLKL